MRNFVGVWELASVVFDGMFFEFLTLLFWRAITFSILFHFLRFLMHSTHQYQGFKFCLHAKNNGALGSDLPWALQCYSCNSITINEQLKDLTHMFCLQIPFYKLYKQGFYYYVFTLKYMCHFGISKKLNLKAKHKIKNKISWLFLVHLLLCFRTYLLT